jgi:hypothetical protein
MGKINYDKVSSCTALRIIDTMRIAEDKRAQAQEKGLAKVIASGNIPTDGIEEAQRAARFRYFSDFGNKFEEIKSYITFRGKQYPKGHRDLECGACGVRYDAHKKDNGFCADCFDLYKTNKQNLEHPMLKLGEETGVNR